jgi:pyridoxal phosphate enzyme (YggS family)
VAELIHGVSAAAVRSNLERVRAEIAGTGRDPAEVEILAAVKYLPAEELTALVQAGVELVGENRAQDLQRKHAVAPDAFTWDFIGHVQSRKVKDVLPLVRYIHSVASDSVLTQLAKHGDEETQVLIEVNVAGEAGKTGISPSELPDFLERCPVPVIGLMTMPPFTQSAEDSRRYFSALRDLAEEQGLRHLSMGTSQDYLVAVQEGATIVRLGTTLYTSAP